ncbi:unnamed protein product [Paramecium primaurelia]|uniref:Heat shock protein 70 n=1 Tax=Paramecium primaurelia TaxID=5886 RepID=A0A8S1PBV7_PARPR|nr:unnamed protein product [Paramecium primaurelia]
MKTIFTLLLIIGIWAQQTTNQISCPVIGIDLGTTYSCVGIFKKGTVEIIPNDQGNRITPSVVAFTDEERLIGESAKNQATFNPSRTLYDVKRLIGRKYTDSTVQYDKKFMPYDIVEKDSKPYIMVSNIKGVSSKIFAPEEISAMVLMKMKEISETYLGKKVENAIVTVPAYFNDAQRQATKDAGTIAGLNVLRVLNEPTAAAIAYGLDKKDGEKNILVFDLGGGTFDVSILTIDNGVFEVIATSGDTHLGGEDFDQRVIDHFLKVIKKKHNKDLSGDKRVIQKLKKEVEKAKRSLSATHETKLEIEDLVDGLDFQENLTRSKFEELNNDLFKKTIGPMQLAMEDSKLKKTNIDEIILVGGSTRIPKIRQIVKEFFNGKELNTGINPDEAVCYGAAIQGAIICGDSNEINDFIVIDATPLSLGIETVGGVLTKIIPKGSSIPNKKSQIFTTYQDQQQTVTISVYEGERPLVKDNHKLGTFDLTGIPPSPRGTPQIEVTFEINADGILQVSASEKSSGKAKTIFIQNNSDRLSKEEIEKMLQDAKTFEIQDRIAKEIIDSRNSLENYIYSMINQIEDPEKLANQLSDNDKETIRQALKESQDWIQNNQNVEKEDYEQELKELQKICNPIISKLHQQENNDQRYSQENYDSEL